MIVVSDTSPISALLTIDEIDLLSKLFSEVIIPVAVHTELLRSHSNLPKWLRVELTKNLSKVQDFQTLADAGEAEAIQLAMELNADRLLIDDNKGRKLAEREGVPAIGLVGVLVLAKRKNFIPSIRTMIERLKAEAHVYLSDEIVTAAVRAAGE